MACLLVAVQACQQQHLADAVSSLSTKMAGRSLEKVVLSSALHRRCCAVSEVAGWSTGEAGNGCHRRQCDLRCIAVGTP